MSQLIYSLFKSNKINQKKFNSFYTKQFCKNIPLTFTCYYRPGTSNKKLTIEIDIDILPNYSY